MTRPGDERLSDETTDVNFLRKNTNQFADFSHGRGDATVRYSFEPSHGHEVEFLLPQTRATRSSTSSSSAPLLGAAVNNVQADFNLTFGYQ